MSVNGFKVNGDTLRYDYRYLDNAPDVKEILNIVPPRLRNSGTANGVTLTVNDDGSYTVSGTCTASVRFDLYGSMNNIPSWLERGKEYYCVAYGREKATVVMYNYQSSFVEITQNFDGMTLFACPDSGGFYLSISVSAGVQYNETIRIVILERTETIDGAYYGLKNNRKVQENDERLAAICNVLPEIDSITINGVTLTNIGGGKYTLVGTSTADTNFTFYTNANDVPNWLSRSKEYYAILQGANSIYCRMVVAKRPSYEFLARTRDKLVAFTVPETGGIMISINIDGNNTFNEIVTPVIVEKGYFTELYFLPKVQENDARLSAICNVLPEIPSTTVNGIELTNIGNGQYTITGTATADTNITFFTSASDVPDFLERGGKYSATLQGAKVARFIITTRPGYAFLATAKNYLAQFEVPSDGGMMIALNLDGGATYDETITPIIVRDGYFPQLYLPKKTIVVSNNVAEGDFGKIRDAVNYANKHKGTTIIIKEGSYDLVSEFGQSYLDGLSDSNPDYGIDLGNEVKIICSPRANIYFDYDGTNEWVVRYFSPFNTLNSSYEVVGMHIIAHNCRYIVHDDPRWPDKTNFSHNVWRECYFEIFPSPQVESWVNHQIIGGGFGTNTLIEFDACIFNAHYSGVERYSSLSYHNDVSGWSGSRSFLAIKNCYFANGNRVIIQGYGNSTEKSQVIIAGNSFEDVTTDILYMSSDADNIDVYQYNNQSR